jgi:hypothetical protein
MKKITVNILVVAVLTIISGSCEEIIEFKGVDAEPKIVLYSKFELNKEISLTLARSYAIFDATFRPAQISNAVVKLYRDGEYAATLTYKPAQAPQYGYPPDPISTYIATGISPEPGSLYRIEAEVPGLPPVWAEVSLPEPVAIVSIDTTMTKRVYEDTYYSHTDILIKAKVRFSDPADKENYYRITVMSLSGSYSGQKNMPYDPEMPVMVHYNTVWYPAANDPLINPQREDDLFGSPQENRYSLFSDELISGRSYELKLDMAFSARDTTLYEFTHFIVDLQSISKDLYLYLISSSAHERSKDNPLAEPVIVYSNVNNGLGVIGAVTSSRSTIKYGQYPVTGVKYEEGTGYNY